MNGLFNECYSLKNIDLSNIKTNKVINMSYMFCNCISLTSLDLSNFNTQNVIDMDHNYFIMPINNFFNF